MQRALKEPKPPEVPSVKSPISSNTLKKDIKNLAEPEQKVSSAPQSPQKKLSATPQPDKIEAATKPEVEKQPSTAPSQKKPQESQKTSNVKETQDPKLQTECRESKAAAAAQPESGGLFGFGGGKTRPTAEKSTESVTGKMFGFGSSIFGSASALITSAVQDQPKTTPPVSPKMSPAKEIKPPASQKTELVQQTKTTPLAQDKVDKPLTEHPKAAVKPDVSSCPLCKAELNTGPKTPSNYRTCTNCKNVVCNQCGFNPMPNESDVSEIHKKFVPQ